MQEKSGIFCEVIKGEAIFEPQNLLIFGYFFGIIFSQFKRTYYLLIMSDSTDDLPFSQRYGYAPVVQQLALGEITTAFREEIKALLDETIIVGRFNAIENEYADIIQDIFINFYEGNYRKFSRTKSFVKDFLDEFVDKCNFFRLFDLLEQLIKDLKQLNTDNIGYKNVMKILNLN